jgi:stage II sporulation protein GA (sporulation sigma-E factor processing peptidase)
VELQPVPVVYVDVAFLVNFVTDVAWLLLTAGLAGVRVRVGRVVFASAVGAAAAVWSYFPGDAWLRSPWGAMGGAVVLACLAYLPVPLRRATRVLAYFLFTGGVMAGVVMLVGRLAPEAAETVPSGLAASGLLLCMIGARYLWAAARERKQLAQGLWRVRVRLGAAVADLAALVDTGNTLRAPLTGTPVVVVEASALLGLVPAEVTRTAVAGWASLERLSPEWAARFRPVPYQAVGRENGVLPAFAVDELAVQEPGSTAWRTVSGLVGLAGFALHPDGAYQALLPGQVARHATCGSEMGG